jgi:hypothetical protein
MNDFTENPRFAFVVAEFPKNEYGEPDKATWDKFLGNIGRNKRQAEVAPTIHDNIWLIPLNTGMPFLNHLMQCAEPYPIPLRILFLNDEPDWIKYPPDDSSKP